MTQSNVVKATKKAHDLDKETQELLHSVKKKNNKAVGWFVVCFVILFLVGLASYIRINQSITKQNQIAEQNKAHIDCIVKLFTSENRATKIITNPESTCNIVEQ